MTAPSIVKLAKQGDEAKIFDIFVLAHKENGYFPMSSKKVIDMIMKACRHEGASIGLIKDHQGNVEAASGLIIETSWYSDQVFLADLINFVHPAHRKSRHAEAILQFQKDTATYLSKVFGYDVPTLPSILTRESLVPKMRFYRKRFKQVGAIYVFNDDKNIPKDQFNQTDISYDAIKDQAVAVKQKSNPATHGTVPRDVVLGMAG